MNESSFNIQGMISRRDLPLSITEHVSNPRFPCGTPERVSVRQTGDACVPGGGDFDSFPDERLLLEGLKSYQT